jgi:hypothetical protein
MCTGGTNLRVLGDLGRSSQTPYPYYAYSLPSSPRLYPRGERTRLIRRHGGQMGGRIAGRPAIERRS